MASIAPLFGLMAISCPWALGTWTSAHEVLLSFGRKRIISFIFTIFYTYFEEKYPLKNSEKEVFDEKFLKELDIYLVKRDFKLKNLKDLQNITFDSQNNILYKGVPADFNNEKIWKNTKQKTSIKA